MDGLWFIVECSIIDLESKEKFLESYEKRKKGVLLLKVYCYDDDNLLAEFEGKYVAFK